MYVSAAYNIAPCGGGHLLEEVMGTFSKIQLFEAILPGVTSLWLCVQYGGNSSLGV